MSKPSNFRTRKTQEAGRVLDATVRRLRLDKKFDQYAGFLAWPEIVGGEIAKVAKPVKISRVGVLEIKTLDAAWCQELYMKKIELLEAWNKDERTSPINDMRFVAGNPNDFK